MMNNIHVRTYKKKTTQKELYNENYTKRFTKGYLQKEIYKKKL